MPVSFDMPGTQLLRPPWPRPTCRAACVGCSNTSSAWCPTRWPAISAACSTSSSSNCSASPTTRAIPACRPGTWKRCGRMRLNRADLVPRYLIGLEAALAAHPRRRAARPRADQAAPAARSATCSLVDDDSMDEERVLRDIALRHESRASLPCTCSASASACSPARRPSTPSACRSARRRCAGSCAKPATACRSGSKPRLLLFRTFDRIVMQHYTQLAETMNALLEREACCRAWPTCRSAPARCCRTPSRSRAARSRATAARRGWRRRRWWRRRRELALGGGDEIPHPAGSASTASDAAHRRFRAAPRR